MKKIYISFCFIFLFFVSNYSNSIVYAGNPEEDTIAYTIDASGRDGQDGSAGTTDSNGNGTNATSATRGENAADILIDVTVDGNNRLIISGTHSANIQLPINGKILLKANGGRGGSGGTGGKGVDGANGQDGTNASNFFIPIAPTDGTNGGNGGNGGDGTPGENGGDAGDTKVRVDEKQSYLLLLFKFENNLGPGGREGENGRGGVGGTGGRAGDTHYWEDGQWVPYTNMLGLQVYTRNGSNGRNGQDGRGRTNPGTDGRAAEFSIQCINADGTTASYKKPFQLELIDVEYKEEFEDGMLEPGEKIFIQSLIIKNNSEMPTPRGLPIKLSGFTNENLQAMNFKDVNYSAALGPFKTAVLKVGKGDKTNNDLIVHINSHVFEGEPKLESEWKPSFVFDKFTATFARGFPITIQYPLQLVSSENRLSYDKLDINKKLQFEIKNIAEVTDKTSLDRTMHFRINYLEGDLDFNKIKLKQNAVPIDVDKSKKSWTILNPDLIDPKTSKTFVYYVDILPKAQYMTSARLSFEVLFGDLNGSELHLVQSQPIVIEYNFPKDNNFEYSQGVSDLGIKCKYAGNNTEYLINTLWVNRVEGADLATVQYETNAWFYNNSPEYSVSLKDLGRYLWKFSSGEALSAFELKNLLKNVLETNYYGQSEDNTKQECRVVN